MYRPLWGEQPPDQISQTPESEPMTGEHMQVPMRDGTSRTSRLHLYTRFNTCCNKLPSLDTAARTWVCLTAGIARLRRTNGGDECRQWLQTTCARRPTVPTPTMLRRKTPQAGIAGSYWV
jgi:hypothetical protein